MSSEDLLESLCFETRVESLLEKVGGFGELFFIRFLKNPSYMTPAIQSKERSKIFDALYDSNIMKFLEIMNLEGYRANLDEEDDYDSVKSISVDDMNLLKILRMISAERFPVLVSLKLNLLSNIKVDSNSLKNLQHLTLINNGKNLLKFPELRGIRLETLTLKGFGIGFTRALPKVLFLEECFVAKSSGLGGCEEMTLVDSLWDTMSFPSKVLKVEACKISKSIPNSLEVLYLINAPCSIDLSGFMSLYELRIDESVEVEGVLPVNLKVLSCHGDFLTETITLPKLEELNIKGGEPRLTYPRGIREVVFTGCVLNVEDEFKMLGTTKVKSVKFIECQMEAKKDIEVVGKRLEKILFFKCTGNKIKLSIDQAVELIVVGGLVDANLIKQFNTELLFMNNRERKLYLLDKSFSTEFSDFWDCLEDIAEHEPSFVGEFLALPYMIPVPPKKRYLDMIGTQKVNSQTLITLSGRLYPLENMMKIKNSGGKWPEGLVLSEDLEKIISKIGKRD